MNIQEMINKFFTPEERYRRRTPMGLNRQSKHMGPGWIKATKKYADGRQMAAHNRRPMRKRK